MDNNQDRWWEHPEVNNRPPLPQENTPQSEMPQYPTGYQQGYPQNYQQPVDNGVQNGYYNGQNQYFPQNQEQSYGQQYNNYNSQNPNECQNWQPQQQPDYREELPQNQKKQKKQKPRKKIRFKDIFLLFLILAIGFFAVQYFMTENFFNKALADEPFLYSVETDYRDYVTNDIILPETIGDGEIPYEIIWESSHPDILGSDGVVTRPADRNQKVTLTLKLKQFFWYAEREYEFIVIKSDEIDPDNIFVITEKMIEDGIATNEFLVTYNEDGSIYSISGNFNNTVIASEGDALAVVNAYRNLLKIADNVSFKLDDVQTSLIGKTYSFVPMVNDLIISGQRIVISTNNDYLRSIVTTVQTISADLGDSLSDEELASIAAADLECETVTISNVEKSVYNDVVAYKFIALDENTGKGLWIYIVNADSKEIISKKSAVASAWEAVKASGKDDAGREHSFNVKRVDKLLGDKYYFQDPNRNISIVNGTLTNFALAYYGKNYNVIDSSKNDWNKYPQGISCMANMTKTYDWYKNMFGFKSFDGKGQPIYMFIGAENIDETILDNAAYVGGDVQVFFSGSGDTHFKYSPCTALDVVAHEYTHGVFHHIANKSFADGVMMESINEGYADIFGCLVEGNWTMGEFIINNYGALRDPSGTVTNLKYKFPTEYLGEYWDYSDGHNNSILLSKTAYEMTKNGFTNDDVARIWFQSLYYGYDDLSNFLTVRSNVEQAARDLGYSDEQIVVIGDIFASFKIGEMATKKIESFAVDGDRLKDNTTERTYILVFSPIGTVIADTPIWIFEEDNSIGTTATDEQMETFLSSYLTTIMNADDEAKEWSLEVDYYRYPSWAMDIIGKFVDDAKQGLIGQMTAASGMEEEDANIWLSLFFFGFKYEGTAYEFYSDILELDYSKVIINEDGTISYDFT